EAVVHGGQEGGVGPLGASPEDEVDRPDLVGRDAVLAGPAEWVAARREVCGRFTLRVHGGDGWPGRRRGRGGDRPRSRTDNVESGAEGQGGPGGQGEAKAGGGRHGGLLSVS